MPTTAKLVAALAFALVAVLAAFNYLALLPRDTPPGMLFQVSAGVGVVTGWIVMGNSVGRNYAEAAASGLRTSITIVFFVTLAYSVYQMLEKSKLMIYHGPTDALLGALAFLLKDARLMLDWNFVGVVALGGMVAGMFTEYAHRRWP